MTMQKFEAAFNQLQGSDSGSIFSPGNWHRLEQQGAAEGFKYRPDGSEIAIEAPAARPTGGVIGRGR